MVSGLRSIGWLAASAAKPMTPDKPFQTLAIAFVLLWSSAVFAQGPLPDAPASRVEPAEPLVAAPRPEVGRSHRFWDKENCALFALNAALSGADFAITRSNLRAGGTEMNPVVRILGTSTPGLAANFVGETAGVVTLGYFFHRTGHHRLERAVSFVNLGASAGAVTYGSTHRGVRPTAKF
jgi:hypothetical protein